MNRKQTTKLSPLSMNKTVVFYSPMEGEDTLVRTGVTEEGNSLFHAVLHACSTEYVQAGKKERVRMAEKLKEKLVSKKWSEPSDVKKEFFSHKISTLFQDFYRYLENKPLKLKETENLFKAFKKDQETYEIVKELLPIEEVNNVVSDVIMNEDVDNWKEKCSRKVESYIKKQLDQFQDDLEDKKKTFIIERVHKVNKVIMTFASEEMYKNFLKKFDTTSMNSTMVNGLQSLFERDIYFINAKDRLPYHFDDSIENKNRTAVVVMLLDDNHYEIVGKLLAKNRIQREFDTKESLIKRITTFLYKPEKINKLYPNLKPYLRNPSSEDENSKSRSKSKSKSLSKSKSKSQSKSQSKSHSKSEESGSEVSSPQFEKSIGSPKRKANLGF